MSVCLSLEDYKKYSSEFNIVKSVDKELGANIGRIWLEVLGLDGEVSSKVTGFVSRGVSVYALVSDMYDDSFNFYEWVSSRLTFDLKTKLTPFNYQLIMGEGTYPRPIEEILLELKSLRGSSTVPISYDDGATTVLEETYFTLKTSRQEFDIYEEDGKVSIGRKEDPKYRKSFILDEKGVSRNHCLVRVLEGSLSIYDLNSTNGVRLNGSRITPSSWVLVRDGDTIRIGTAEITVSAREV